MKNKLLNIIKIVIVVIFTLVWLFLVQGEYEMITKPYLRAEFPVFHGIWAVIVLGLVLVLIIIAIVTTIMSMVKKEK